jgi:DNA-binding protein H-NS
MLAIDLFVTHSRKDRPMKLLDQDRFAALMAKFAAGSFTAEEQTELMALAEQKKNLLQQRVQKIAALKEAVAELHALPEEIFPPSALRQGPADSPTSAAPRQKRIARKSRSGNIIVNGKVLIWSGRGMPEGIEMLISTFKSGADISPMIVDKTNVLAVARLISRLERVCEKPSSKAQLDQLGIDRKMIDKVPRAAKAA